MRVSHLLLAALAATALSPPAAKAAPQTYVVMGTPHVNLRTGPGTEHVVVARAEKGDIFHVTGQTGGWWEIRMFSGDARYVSKAVRVYPLEPSQLVEGHGMTLPESAARCNSMRQSVLMGLDRAQREADELLPRTVDAQRHDSFRRVLEDKILLETFHNYGLQPALYEPLMAMDWSRWD
jgi:hypothetical protein